MAQGAVAQAQLQAGQIAEARRTIEGAIGIRDDIVDLHLLHGRIEAAAHAPSNAFAAYSNALALDSANGEALLGVAHYGMESGHLQESEEATDRVLTLDPEQPDALLMKGIYNIVHNRSDAALTNAEAILSKTPSSESGAILKARALSILDRSDEALKLVEATRKSSGESAGITRTLIELYRLKSDGPAMVQQFDAMRRFTPDDESVVLDEANTLYKLGNAARARTFLRTLILHPTVGDVDARLVTDLWKEYDPTPLDTAGLSEIATKANRAAKKAVARFYLLRNDPVQAMQALGNDMSDTDFLSLRAQAAIAQGKVAEGLATADQILGKDKTSCDALLARGQATLALRRYNDAIITSQIANANCPQMAPAYVVLARAQEGMKNDNAAELAFRNGINRNVQDSWMAQAYTAWLAQRGNDVRAVATARRLTNSTPALVSGWKLYGALCNRYPDNACESDAQSGLAYAQQRFAVDRRPDDPERPGLFSRLDQKRPDDDGFDAAAAARSSRQKTPDASPGTL